MKFCQSDGTSLIDDAPVSGGEDDPFKTVLASPSANEPDEPDFDPMKTMLASPPPVDAPPPPSPFGSGSDPLKKEASPETEQRNSSPFGSAEPPRFNDSPFNQPQPPEDRNSGGFNQSPSGGFNEPQRQEERTSGGFGEQRPFQDPPPFGNQPNFSNDPFNNQQNDWSAPPAPQGWGNEGLGQNTPFSPPPAASNTNSLPMIMGIISLILGLISFPACFCYLNFLTGPIGIITGAIAFFTAGNDPTAKNGKLMGIVGAALSLLSIVILIVLFIIGVGLGSIGNIAR